MKVKWPTTREQPALAGEHGIAFDAIVRSEQNGSFATYGQARYRGDWFGALVHGDGDHGFVPILIGMAREGYVGEGLAPFGRSGRQQDSRWDIDHEWYFKA